MMGASFFRQTMGAPPSCQGLFEKNPIQYHISSSIWAGMKNQILTVIANSRCNVGNGSNINFWTDCWLSNPIVDLLDIPDSVHHLLRAKVEDFIEHGKWKIPQAILEHNHNLSSELSRISIPISPVNDSLYWAASNSGELTSKDAYNFLFPVTSAQYWCKLIWSTSIPPSKSFLIWRLIHNKVPTEDKLWSRGCHVVSICSLCCQDYETSDHLFFGCSFALRFWHWLSYVLNMPIDTSSIQTVLSVCSRNWSFQVKDIIVSAIVNVIGGIWFCRNQLKFEGKVISFEASLNLVRANVALSGNSSSGSMSSSIEDFIILKHFQVIGKPIRAPVIMEIFWYPPKTGWVKANSDGAARGSPGRAACGGIFRDNSSAILGCFSYHIGISEAFSAEIMGAILSIELANKKNWRKLWLECDSKLAVESFSNPKLVPWPLRNR